jgi:hypothetical protein
MKLSKKAIGRLVESPLGERCSYYCPATEWLGEWIKSWAYYKDIQSVTVTKKILPYKYQK